MKIFMIGDFVTSSGPASVNKVIKKYADNDFIFSKKNKNVERVCELIKNIRMCDAVIFSGLSKINLLGIYIAKVFCKKSAYIMHGYSRLENEINKVNNIIIIKLEEKIINKVDKVICVSKTFGDYMKKQYPTLENKIYNIQNPIKIEFNEEKINSNKRNRNNLLSLGGGLPIKNIKAICKAVEIINNERTKENRLNLIVIGGDGADLPEIKKYNFVDYRGKVDYKKIEEYYSMSSLYIQNSLFETFGIAPLEALKNGCDILISKNVASKEVISTLLENDIINDANSIEEIKEKIKYNIDISNSKRLYEGIDIDSINPINVINRIKEIITI